MATPSTPQQQRDAIRETLRLVGDLSDALATQLGRVERLAGGLSSPPPGVGSELAEDAARIKKRCEQLREELDRQQARQQWFSPPHTAEDPAADEQAGRGDAARSLTIELKLEGRSRAEVEEYLGTTFGRSDAAGIVEDVFAGEGRR